MKIECANILAVPADALLLTIDGAKCGMEGNLARQFEKRWPEDWKDMQRDIRYPIPLGRTIAIQWDGDFPWPYVLMASTLHHLDILSDSEKRGIVRSAFGEAIGICQRLGIRTLSTTVLMGGWRLPLTEAFRAMQDSYYSSHAHLRGPGIRVFVMNETDRVALNGLVAAIEAPSRAPS